MKFKLNYLLLLMIISMGVFAQKENSKQYATLIVTAESMIEIPSISEQIASGDFIPSQDIVSEVNPKMMGVNKAVPGKGLPIGGDPLWKKQSNAMQIKGEEPLFTFQAASANATPTDPTGAVGTNHFINAWNSSFRIWDKEGNPLTSPAALGTILYGNMGDPIVFFDQFADRFVITEFYSNGFGIAVCQGSDPVNDGWYLYTFNTNSFPDYPKFSLWSDGYYITANKSSGSPGFSQVVFACDREKMLAGDPSATMVGFPLPDIENNGFYSPLGFNANGSTPPPPGNAPIVYMQDDVWNGVSTDHLKIWSINMDWSTPSNSTISDPQEIVTTPFDGLFDGGSFSNLPQPSGGDIDALQATIMYMAQYRRFADHNSVVFNFVVDLDGSDDYAGIRWYELRQENDGDPWEIYQEGTYAQPEGHSAFSGNMAMDINGNIGLAYTIVSESQYPSLRFTGRFASDPLGIMTLEEGSIAEGTQSDPSTRYGDYSQMTVDPVDDKTFWSIGEYFNGGPRKDQVGVFRIASILANDVGVISIDSPTDGVLTATEPITVTLRNFGIDTQTSIPVSFQIDEGSIITEVFNGSIAGGNNQQFTFNATGDFSVLGQTYQIKAFTELGSDENADNDMIITEVTHLYADDLGVTEVVSPVSGIDLNDDESIIITIKNFGADSQNGFDVTYILDGGDPVTEEVSESLAGTETLSYTFETPGDFSALGDHELSVATSLPDDADPSNDEFSTIITKTLCEPESNCTFGAGIDALQLAEIDNPSGCDPNGYGNYIDLTATLNRGNTHDLTVTTGYGDMHIRVWINFNGNASFEGNEIVVDDFIIAEGQGSGTYTEIIPITIPDDAELGYFLMRVKANYDAAVPNYPCQETMFGETEDYTVHLVFPEGIEDLSEPSNMRISYLENDHFEVSFRSVEIKDALNISVIDLLGHTLIYNVVENMNGSYTYDFDMSYAEPGVYLVRLGNDSFIKVERIVVK